MTMARRAAPPRGAPKKGLTPGESPTGITRLQKRVEELTAFDPQKMTQNYPPELQALSTAIQTTLARVFGEDTADYRRFLPATDLQWSGPLFLVGGMPPPPPSEYIEGVA